MEQPHAPDVLLPPNLDFGVHVAQTPALILVVERILSAPASFRCDEAPTSAFCAVPLELSENEGEIRVDGGP